MCTSRTNQVVSSKPPLDREETPLGSFYLQAAAWGTHGIKMRPPYFLVENTDPLHNHFYDLPDDACPITWEPWQYNVTLTYRHYMLGPDTDPAVGQQYYDSSANPLGRRAF